MQYQAFSYSFFILLLTMLTGKPQTLIIRTDNIGKHLWSFQGSTLERTIFVGLSPPISNNAYWWIWHFRHSVSSFWHCCISNVPVFPQIPFVQDYHGDNPFSHWTIFRIIKRQDDNHPSISCIFVREVDRQLFKSLRILDSFIIYK